MYMTVDCMCLAFLRGEKQEDVKGKPTTPEVLSP